MITLLLWLVFLLCVGYGVYDLIGLLRTPARKFVPDLDAIQWPLRSNVQEIEPLVYTVSMTDEGVTPDPVEQGEKLLAESPFSLDERLISEI